ncbi:peptide deformylase 1A [Carex littledalei]|uniref:Peptide deformylase n=1 Tax=Carex littledalei TaxID=544730 RepID=A0A833QHB4_9POAL|nr:peptide deformylase 1A [Carex littledalei]
MEGIQCLCWYHSQRLIPLSLSVSGTGVGALIHTAASKTTRLSYASEIKIVKRMLSTPRSRSRFRVSATGWFSGFGSKKAVLPEIVKAGDPVLHEPAKEVAKEEIGSEKIEKVIEDMIAVMRNAPGVGLAAPQIGIPLKIIVLEDTKEYISYARQDEIEVQDRHPFDLLVILNPKLRNLSNKKAIFFEGCLSVDGFRAAVERDLEVEVSGLGRDGRPIKLEARGWQARILQHECDHLDGTLYVDKIVKRTFRTVENLELPLPVGCPPLGVR